MQRCLGWVGRDRIWKLIFSKFVTPKFNQRSVWEIKAARIPSLFWGPPHDYGRPHCTVPRKPAPGIDSDDAGRLDLVELELIPTFDSGSSEVPQ